MKLFVLGLERCGTHSAADIVRAAHPGKKVYHEKYPYLCCEALQKFQGLPFNKIKLEEKLKQWSEPDFICEANHRLSFFVEELLSIPDAKFLLLLREPVDVLKSRIMILSYYPQILNMVDEDLSFAFKSQYQHDYNRYRLRPSFSFDKVYQYYLWELTQTLYFVMGSLKKLPRGRYMVVHAARLADKLKYIIGDGDYESARRQSLIKSDKSEGTFREKFRKYAEELIEPYREEIEESFLLAASGYNLSHKKLGEFLYNPVIKQ